MPASVFNLYYSATAHQRRRQRSIGTPVQMINTLMTASYALFPTMERDRGIYSKAVPAGADLLRWSIKAKGVESSKYARVKPNPINVS